MEVLSGKPDILTVTANGYGKRTSLDEYRVQGRGGSGSINMRTTARNGQVVNLVAVNESDPLFGSRPTGSIGEPGPASLRVR